MILGERRINIFLGEGEDGGIGNGEMQYGFINFNKEC